MILKVGKIWANLDLNYSFASKGNFSRKLAIITFVYLVNPIILLHFKQILRADHKISGYIILVEIDSKLPICPKRVFLAKLTVTIVYLLYSFMLQHFRKIFREKIKRQKVA